MNSNTRLQLTLFLDEKDKSAIERIRATFNPSQQQLIDSHVTLCREDELLDLNKILYNIQHLDTSTLTIHFGNPTRFDNNKGVLLPAFGNNEQFQQIREKILAGTSVSVRRHEPHITLIHPRNSSCTDEIFEEIQQAQLPSSISFNAISLIKQINGGPWQIIKRFDLKAIEY